MRLGRWELADGARAWIELEADHGHRLDAPPWLGGRRTGERVTQGTAIAPVAPSKIVCIGRNYRAHAAELGNEVPAEPLLFLKPPSAILGPGGAIELPPQSQRVEHEVELGVVVGAPLRRASEAQAREAIWGYTIVADITARDLQRSDGQWTRAKGFDTFCPVGPVVVRGLDAAALDITCTVSGVVRQRGSTADMVFGPAALLAYISQVMTLEPGDLVSTGTPEGVGPLKSGDNV
ncbi:MAG TPA: fumarylacetoacetate hydrolase family protein, partial [Polyangiaceae bacterium]|nr:fumarylacetoacetate hydrolase family protein [Polyangiaceae bacterium]